MEEIWDLPWDEKKIHHICTCGKVFGVDDWRMEDRIGPFTVITRYPWAGFLGMISRMEIALKIWTGMKQRLSMIQYLSQKTRALDPERYTVNDTKPSVPRLQQLSCL
ncbi:MAG: hypothetical protein M3115_00100 [Thermoproteota archaeon]|nr:hypothetical protein [Thermoproteota archaeon]